LPAANLMAFLAARSEVDFGGGGGVFERDVVLDANGEADDVAAPPNVGALAAAACMAFLSSPEMSKPDFFFGVIADDNEDEPKEGLGPPPNVGAFAAAACMAFRSSSERSNPVFLFGFGGGLAGVGEFVRDVVLDPPSCFSFFSFALRRAFFSSNLFCKSDWEAELEVAADEAREDVPGLKVVAVGFRLVEDEGKGDFEAAFVA